MKYIAYGSNMAQDQMARRCPDHLWLRCDDALHLQKRKDPVQIISGQDPFTRQVDVADLICKCGWTEVNGAGVHVLRKRAGQLPAVGDVRFDRHDMSSFLG